MIRKGYWRILFRRMQDKVAAGENAFIHNGQARVIASLCTLGDISLEDGGKLSLAQDGEGNQIILNLDDAGVFIQDKNEDVCEKVSDNLADFVDSLRSITPVGLSLGAVVDDIDEIIFPRRGILNGDG